MNIYSNKRGGAIVESALIFPLTIVVVVSLITLIIELYDSVHSRVDYDLAIRRYAGSASLTVSSNNSAPIQLTGIKEKGGSIMGYKTISIEHEMDSRQNGFFKWGTVSTETISYEIIDESRLIRNADLISEGLKTLLVD